jgi:DNA-binding CsgD family transcriptional regulator
MTTFKITPRDQEVLDLLCEGCSNKEIADTLGISPRTVKEHVRILCVRAGITGETSRKRVRLAMLTSVALPIVSSRPARGAWIETSRHVLTDELVPASRPARVPDMHDERK